MPEIVRVRAYNSEKVNRIWLLIIAETKVTQLTISTFLNLRDKHSTAYQTTESSHSLAAPTTISVTALSSVVKSSADIT